MFTGIVSDIGRITGLTRATGGGARLRVACGYRPETVAIGASIACAGVCLTVVNTGETEGEGWFEADVSSETLALTTLGALQPGASINLERSLKAGDELGGHIVQGHIDGVAEIVDRRPDGESLRFGMRAPDHLARFIASKGAVALDGTSLTVNEVSGPVFGVNIIPHTRDSTTWKWRGVGDGVNLEIDVLARYVARLAETAGCPE